MKLKVFIAASAGGVIFLSALSAPILAAPVVGSTIEVREGDTWTKVKVIGAEGTRVHVHYDDGTEEWVGSDRLKSAGGGSGNTPGAPLNSGTGAPSVDAKTAPAKDATVSRGGRFSVGDAIEVKRDGQWMPAKVKQVTAGWILVSEERADGKSRWAEPWALRVEGSAYDINNGGTTSRDASIGELPPNQRPAAQPLAIGNSLAPAPEGQRPLSKTELEKNFETIVFSDTHEPAPVSEPLRLATTRPAVTGEFSAWGLRGVENNLGAVLACPNSAKVAVAAFPGQWGKWTEIVRANLQSHGQLDTRYIYVPELKVMSAAEDGDLILTLFGWDKNVQLWKWDKTAYHLVFNVQASTNSGVESAILLGPDRAVIRERDGQTTLIDVQKKQAISSIGTSPTSRMFVHPSGQMVGVITARGTAMLLRGADFGVLAELPDAGGTSNVAVDSAGQFAAYELTSGGIRVVRIADGSPIGTVSVGAAFDGLIDLVEEKFLIVNHTTVYEVKSGIPVWIYNMPPNALVTRLINGQFLIASGGNQMASMAMATLPDQTGRSALKSATPDRFMLRPGTPVKIDGDFGAFAEEHTQAADAVKAAIEGAGLSVSDKDEAFHLSVGVAPGPSEKRDYAPDIFAGPMRVVTTVDVPSNIFTATLRNKGEAVWSQTIRFAAGGTIQKDSTHTFQDAANAGAKPVAAPLKALSVPSFLPTGAKPGTPAALGSSNLQGSKFVPDHPLAAKVK